MAATARWANRYPVLADAADVPLWMQRLAEDLDNVAKDTQGTLASRPTAATAKYGAYYFATDTGQLFRSDGTNWIEIIAGISQTAEIGDYKISAQVADHGALGGGRFRWLRLDSPARAMNRADYPLLWDLFRQGGSTSPFGNGNGTTTFTLPDAAGRVPVIKGSHADVDSFGDSDGLAVASRSPKHNSTVTDPGHVHSAVGRVSNTQSPPDGSTAHTGFSGAIQDTQFVFVSSATTGVSVGPGGGGRPVDQPAHIVLGNMFIKAA